MHANVIGQYVSQMEAVIGHIASLFSAIIPISLTDGGNSEADDATDTYLLVVLAFVLVLVLRARQQRAAARAAPQQGQALGQGGVGRGMPLAGDGLFGGVEPPQAGGAAGLGQQ